MDKDSLFRLDKNVLRIFDSKEARTQAIADQCPWDEIAPLSQDFRKVTDALDARDIPYEVSRKLVRGLDYYTGFVFEAVARGDLGSQDAVAAGGCYDHLVEELGGPSAGAVGFAAGIERLLLAGGVSETLKERYVYLALTEKSRDLENYCLEIVETLFALGRKPRRNPAGKSMGDHLKRADKAGCRYVLILGEDELKARTVTIKDLKEKSQQTLAGTDWPRFFIERKE